MSKSSKNDTPSYRCIECNENEEKSFDLLCVSFKLFHLIS